jgi:hypothetical protein
LLINRSQADEIDLLGPHNQRLAQTKAQGAL